MTPLHLQIGKMKQTSKFFIYSQIVYHKKCSHLDMHNEDDSGWEFETVKGDDVPSTLNPIRTEEKKIAQLTVRPRQSSVLPSSLRLLFNGDYSTASEAPNTNTTASPGRTQDESLEPGGETNHSHDNAFCPISSDPQNGSYPFSDLVDSETHKATSGVGQSYPREQQPTVREIPPIHIHQNVPFYSAIAEQRETQNLDLYSMNDPPREVLDSVSSELNNPELLSLEPIEQSSLSSRAVSARSPKMSNTTSAASRLTAAVTSGKGTIPQPTSDQPPDLHFNNFGTPGLKDVIKVKYFLFGIATGH